jgi:hypothetical protein
VHKGSKMAFYDVGMYGPHNVCVNLL